MIAYRTASLADLRTVIDWAAAEGWNPGLDDAEAFYTADPQGFFVATEGETPVAAISVVNHSADFAFLGLYLVLPSHRGRGIGLGLWRHALAHAETRTIGLDGVPDQQANYRASGFAATGTTTRFSGTLAPLEAALNTPDIPRLIAAEAAASGTAKPAYLTAWFQDTDTRRTLVLDPAHSFCTVRRCRGGAKVGPLLAPDAETAERLLRCAAHHFSGEIILDVPQSARGLLRLCQDLGFQPSFETARMYRGPFAAPAPGFFAVTTLELG